MSLFDGLIVNPAETFNTNPSEESPNGGPSDGPVCEICGVDIPLTPTGRKPKRPWRCQDHKTRTSSASGGDVSGGSPRSSAGDKRKQARLDAITGDLTEGLGELAGTIIPVAPVTAHTMALQGPPAVESLVRIASDYPRFLDGLEKAAKAVPFLAVGKFIAAIMLALAVDMGRYEPVGLAAEYLRVAEAADAAGWQPQPATDRNPGASPPAGRIDNFTPPPPAFKLGV